MAVATTSDGRCIRARDSADTLHGWRCGGWGGSGVVDTKKWTNKLGGRWAAAGTARCHVAARAAGCRVSGGDAVPVHLPVDWLVLNGFLKRERGEHGVGSGGGRGRRQRWLVRQLRMRKQRHLDGLTAQVAHLRRDNAHVAIVLGLTTQGLLAVDAENAVLRT
ncbi:hypothetical protein OsJ_33962 [Oryza sativa Japonica Group]|uniref:Uncharacterized protein n=1 Tax=Oryza sativa subsp. japonica TaxID=39947 RepID=B9GAS8_ORYSJ|nr:hypothetical protein OsJ_33962 [Oryza sativa Japonica Group]